MRTNDLTTVILMTAGWLLAWAGSVAMLAMAREAGSGVVYVLMTAWGAYLIIMGCAFGVVAASTVARRKGGVQ